MGPTDTHFSGSIPEIYHRFLGSMFFAPYAADLALRARALGARRILEIAAGTGIVTRALAEALPQAEIEATDLNEAMVSFAAAQAPHLPNVRWATADALHFPAVEPSFDLVVCQFGVMFFPDRVQAFREARRVLLPRGAYLFNVWDGVEHNDVARIVATAAAAVFPDDPPSFVQRVPHGHGDPRALERDLRTAGFTDIVWNVVALRSRAACARDAAIGMCAGTPLRHEITMRDPGRLDDVVERATRDLREAFGDGAIDAQMRAYVFTARVAGR